MKTYLVTGAAGFIGSNFIKYMLRSYDDIRIVVLDALTYAGYLGTIAPDIDNDRCIFVRGDICDRELVDTLFSRHRFDVVVNFAAESHVDRSIENPQLFLQTNILGTQNLLDCARRAWVTGKDEQSGSAGCAIIRYLPTRCMARWDLQASSPKRHPCSPTVHIAQQRPAPTSSSWHIATPTRCPSA